jgi:hypothetical protein
VLLQIIETDYIHAIEHITINAKKSLQQPPQQPLRPEIPHHPIHESEIPPPKNPPISGPSSSRKKLAKTTTQHRMQHRDVVDLTSDEENLIVETRSLSSPKVTMKLSCLNSMNNDFSSPASRR